jgi:hypothetical protein
MSQFFERIFGVLNGFEATKHEFIGKSQSNVLNLIAQNRDGAFPNFHDRWVG